MTHTRIATATAKCWPNEYTFRLYQFGAKTFTWMSGSNRAIGLPNYRSAKAALDAAIENGWTIV